MHQYELHRPVQVKCSCCDIENEFTFKSRSDHVICRGCQRHQGDSVRTLRQRDSDHHGLWASTAAVAAEDAAKRETSLHDRIRSLEEKIGHVQVENDDLRETVRRGFDAAPLPAVEKWLHDAEVQESYRRRDSAFRLRDEAFRAIWQVDTLHRLKAENERQCVCGDPATDCRELVALEPVVGSLDRWEREQLDRLRRGLSCGLPDNHPEWQKHPRRRWSYRPTGS